MDVRTRSVNWGNYGWESLLDDVNSFCIENEIIIQSSDALHFFLENGGYGPSLCINIYYNFLLKLFNTALQEKYKDQTQASSLATDAATPTRLMKGVAMSVPHARTSHLHTSSDNCRPHQNTQQRVGKSKTHKYLT
jgi:hypothetical protein